MNSTTAFFRRYRCAGLWQHMRVMSECAAKLAKTAPQGNNSGSSIGKTWREAVIKKKEMETRQRGWKDDQKRRGCHETQIALFTFRHTASWVDFTVRWNYSVPHSLRCKRGGVMLLQSAKRRRKRFKQNGSCSFCQVWLCWCCPYPWQQLFHFTYAT